jgi:hypothetical protein
LIRIYDQVERGDFTRSTELRLWLDTLGVSPKGQQDRRWVRPKYDRPAHGVPDLQPDTEAIIRRLGLDYDPKRGA